MIIVAFVPDAEHTAGVVLLNVTTSAELAVADKGTRVVLNTCAAGPTKVIVCAAAAMVMTNVCVAAGAVPVAVSAKLNTPAVVGVPVIVAVPELAAPAVKVKPDGAAPAEIVGVGVPVAVMLNVGIAVPTLPESVAGLVKAGGTGVGDGVNALLGAEATLVPPALVAVTVQVYGVPLAKPVMRWLKAVVPVCVSVPPAGMHVTA